MVGAGGEVVVAAQPYDERHVAAGQALGLPVEQIAVQCGLVGDLLYVWDKPLGRTLLVGHDLQLRKFPSGTLLEAALRTYRRLPAAEA